MVCIIIQLCYYLLIFITLAVDFCLLDCGTLSEQLGEISSFLEVTVHVVSSPY